MKFQLGLLKKELNRKFDSLNFLVHGSVRDFLRYLSLTSSKLSLLLEKVGTVSYPVWDSKMINIELFWHKPSVVLTQVVHKSSWAKLKPIIPHPKRKWTHEKNTTRCSETNKYFNNTTHELFRFKRRFEIRYNLQDMEQDTFLDWLSISAIMLKFPVFVFAKQELTY